MIYAYLRSDNSVELYASEAGKLPPDAYTICTLDGFMAAWQLRDRFAFARLKRLQNPYEAR
ncbi:MAG: hypothetical protein M3R61_00090 [Chloroflexota bacterium]|nr:hypothetical protein [Chloroflexota bacterium]